MSSKAQRTFLRGALAALVCAAATHVHAASVHWSGGRFIYRTDGATLAEALNVFAAGQQIPLRIEGPLQGIVSGRFDMPPQRFLDALARSYGFVWYYDGAVVYVSPASALARIAIRPHALSANALRASLEQSGVSDAHFPLETDAAAQTLDVQGPASYVERVRAAAERFERDAQKSVHTTVRVFRLAVANAADETRSVDGRTLVVPGVATLLRRRFAPLAAAHTTAAPLGAPAGAEPKLVEFDAALPVIEADAVTNSILIRDKAERMDGDGELVAEFDRRAQLVSVQTWVFDVDADVLGTLAPVLPPALGRQVADRDGQTKAGVASDHGRALLAQLHALAGSGRAWIEIAQTALTENRAPAIIDRHEARLARGDDDGVPDDSSGGLWLSIAPTVDGAAATAPRIGLHVELARRADVREGRSIDESVAPGQCLVIEDPRRQQRPGDGGDGSDSHGTGALPQRRLVLLIPRIAA